MTEQEHATLNNPALLTWARESVGLSLDELAAALKLPYAYVTACEEGNDQLTFADLERWAAICLRSVAVLYLPEVPTSDESTASPEECLGALRLECADLASRHRETYGIKSITTFQRRFFEAAIVAARERLAEAAEDYAETEPQP